MDRANCRRVGSLRRPVLEMMLANDQEQRRAGRSSQTGLGDDHLCARNQIAFSNKADSWRVLSCQEGQDGQEKRTNGYRQVSDRAGRVNGMGK